MKSRTVPGTAPWSVPSFHLQSPVVAVLDGLPDDADVNQLDRTALQSLEALIEAARQLRSFADRRGQ